MKSLYESILSSNGAGIDKLVKNWIESNIAFPEDLEFKNGILKPKNNRHHIGFLNDCNVPSYIKFEDDEKNLTLGVGVKILNSLKETPLCKEVIVGLNGEDTIKDVIINTNKLIISKPVQLKNVTINIIGNPYISEVNFNLKQQKFLKDEKDLKELHVNGYVHKLILPSLMGENIKKHIKKICGNIDDLVSSDAIKNQEIIDYLDNTFGHINVRHISVLPRLSLEHVQDEWWIGKYNVQ